jgi:hypothetical protein
MGTWLENRLARLKGCTGPRQQKPAETLRHLCPFSQDPFSARYFLEDLTCAIEEFAAFWSGSGQAGQDAGRRGGGHRESHLRFRIGHKEDAWMSRMVKALVSRIGEACAQCPLGFFEDLRLCSERWKRPPDSDNLDPEIAPMGWPKLDGG